VVSAVKFGAVSLMRGTPVGVVSFAIAVLIIILLLNSIPSQAIKG